jgi:serine/threonine protein kinase
MSPEQARGEELDTRTDLFSFGAVLYEMVTGRQAFYGTITAVIHDAILNRAPVSLISLNADLPPKLEEIINKALERDRDLRYQHASDIRTDLKRDTSSGRSTVAALSEPVSAPEQVSSGTGTTPAVPRRRRWTPWLAGSLALIVVGLSEAWFLLRYPSQSPSELTQKRLTFNSSQNPVTSAGISPDGKYLAYWDGAGIHVKLLSTGEESLIPSLSAIPAGASWGLDAWFPDGTRLLFDRLELGVPCNMWTVSVMGESARELRENAGG